MATPEPFAVGKCFASVMPEKWTKSIPASLAISAKRKGLGSVCFDRVAGSWMTPLIRSPSTATPAVAAGALATGDFGTVGVSGAADALEGPVTSGSGLPWHPATIAATPTIAIDRADRMNSLDDDLMRNPQV